MIIIELSNGQEVRIDLDESEGDVTITGIWFDQEPETENVVAH